MSVHQANAQVTVIGAGIVGMSCAIQLQRRGLSVQVIDRDLPGEATSHGNAGVIAECGCVPVAVPGFAMQVPRLLLDPHGPLSLPTSYLPKAAPWGMSFIMNSRASRVTYIAQSLDSLLQEASKLHLEQARLTESEGLVHASPYYYLYEDKAAFHNDKFAWNTRRKHGITYDILERDAIRAREPSVSKKFNYALSLHNHAFTSNPSGLVKSMAKYFQRQGGTIIQDEILDIRITEQGPQVLVTAQGELAINKLVVAGGAWSAKLAAVMGDRVPLESERGYHIQIPNPGIALNSPIMFSAGKLVATPMQEGIRLAGLVEIGGLEAQPNIKFGRRLLHHAKQLFPEIDISDFTEWMGHRPSIPDSLPVIGPSSRCSKVFYAFGHQHMGLTLGPRTGHLIAELVCGETPSVDLSPFSVDRF